MNNAAAPNSEFAKNAASKRRTLIKVIFLCAVVTIAMRYQFERRRRAEEALNLDDHEAIMLLHSRLSKLTEAQKLAEINSVMQSTSAAMRYAAVDASETYRGPSTADNLELGFRDSSAETRKRSMDLLIQVSKPRGYPVLLKGLLDEDAWVRDDAAAQLASGALSKQTYVDSRAVPVLIRALNDSNDHVGPLIISVLRKLTGNMWRYSVLDTPQKRASVRKQWIDWWQVNRNNTRLWPDTFAHLEPQSPTRSDPAPRFQVRDTQGNLVSLGLKPWQGSVVLLNFWGTWCPPCKVETPSLVRLHEQYRDRGLQIIGVAEKEDNLSSFSDWCRIHGLKYTQILNGEASTPARVFGNIDEVPVSILIDRQGRIRRRWDGERDYDTFRAAVDSLLHE